MAADFRIEFIMIDDIVTVITARTGFKKGRSVTVADAKLAKIGYKPGSFGKSELLAKLQAISRNGNNRLLSLLIRKISLSHRILWNGKVGSRPDHFLGSSR